VFPSSSLQPLDEHNRALQANVHPLDWHNPKPTGCYNLVVIGAGTAGLVTAAAAAGLGAKVALIERGLMGGDCLNYGCVPSKSLISAARRAAGLRDLSEFGLHLGDGYRVDFAETMRRVRRLRANISRHDSAQRFRQLGVDVYLGDGAFCAPDAVAVAGETLRFRKAVVATGTTPVSLPIPGLAEAGYLTNESVFSLTDLPPRIAIVGGGPVGSELAQAFARLGSYVSLIVKSTRILPRDDADAATVVQRSLERDGVNLMLSAELTRVESRQGEKALHVTLDGRNQSIVVDEILLAAGRVPNVEQVGLDKADIAYNTREGIAVDDRLRTTNRRVYAAGDVCSKYKFTHAADFMARIVVRNALFLGRAKVSALTIPWCTYTHPELAHVGLSAVSAREQGTAIDTFTQPLHEVDRAVLEGETEGFVRIHVRRGTDRIVGGTIVAAHAGEMIGELSLAITYGLRLKQLAAIIHPYPTQAEALRQVGDQYNRGRLAPWIQTILRRWFEWNR
jgi:pyruvate/2-oxoglutarate dehydrogenase complex dihydrolipoamide dehydrogenase (E3) component